jgi:hypothetical protein
MSASKSRFVCLLRWSGAVLAVSPLAFLSGLSGLAGWSLGPGAVLPVSCWVAVAETGCYLVIVYVLLVLTLLVVHKLRDTVGRQPERLQHPAQVEAVISLRN